MEENNTLEESNPLDNYVLYEKKEIPTHVEFTSSEQSKITAGIALGALVSSCVMVLTEVLGYYNILPEGILHFKKKTEEAKEE